MSATQFAVDARLAASDWRELASRDNDGLEVSLHWNRTTGRVKVAVADSRRDERYELDVAGADALAAFHHPYAFAARRNSFPGEASREPADLQLQS